MDGGLEARELGVRVGDLGRVAAARDRVEVRAWGRKDLPARRERERRFHCPRHPPNTSTNLSTLGNSEHVRVSFCVFWLVSEAFGQYFDRFRLIPATNHRIWPKNQFRTELEGVWGARGSDVSQ